MGLFQHLCFLCLFVAQFVVQIFNVFEQTFLGIVYLDKLEPAFAEFLSQGSIANDPAQRRHKRFFVAGRNAETTPANLIRSIFDNLSQKINYASDARS